MKENIQNKKINHQDKKFNKDQLTDRVILWTIQLFNLLILTH